MVCECVNDGWCADAWIGRCGWIGGWTNGCVNVYMMVGVWMHACMDGCGWIGVWMDGCVNA